MIHLPRAIAVAWLALACRAPADTMPADMPAGAGATPGSSAIAPNGAASDRAISSQPAWRRQPRVVLQNVSLPLSQILIRHARSSPSEVSFTRAGWHIMPPPPQRTEAEARAIATALYERARAEPAAFARIAERDSEDVASRGRGGALGNVTALYLLEWPQVLDAVAAIHPGEVTPPVETEFGVHVLYLAPPPEAERVSGERIVIGHDQAGFLAKLRRAAGVSRTREAGLARAREVYEQARANPGGFAELASRYSEHPSIAYGADFGEWSTREPTDYPIQVEVLRRLEVGQVSAPFETLFGWEILRRTAPRPRETFAMTSIEVPFGVSTQPSGAKQGAAAAARAKAQSFADVARAHPERFEELQKGGCCSHVSQWVDGRGPEELMATLRTLRMGEIARQPLRLGLGYVVAKRVAPVAPAQPSTRFDLSWPEL